MTTATSPAAPRAICESSGSRSCESITMRSSGRERGRPERSVSRQSSASTVPIPVRIASCSCRSCCTCARAFSLVIHPRLSSGAEIFPSSVIAAFSVTSGLPVRMKWTKASLSFAASAVYSRATSTWMPAARSMRKPSPETRGFGSSIAATTRAIPAAITAFAQAGVRPWCEHGSRFR